MDREGSSPPTRRRPHTQHGEAAQHLLLVAHHQGACRLHGHTDLLQQTGDRGQGTGQGPARTVQGTQLLPHLHGRSLPRNWMRLRGPAHSCTPTAALLPQPEQTPLLEGRCLPRPWHPPWAQAGNQPSLKQRRHRKPKHLQSNLQNCGGEAALVAWLRKFPGTW